MAWWSVVLRMVVVSRLPQSFLRIPLVKVQTPSSRTAITSSQQQSQAAIRRPSTHASSHSNRHHHVPLAKHINKPLKLHVWRSEPRIWTRKELDRERIAFFDTRVTGRPEIWQTIQQVLDVLWSGGDEGDTDGGLATAQTILDAAGITIPTGDLAGGAYDSFGAHYSLPEYIVSDPQDLAEVPAGNSNQGEDKSGEEGEDSLSEDEILRRRQEKGKAVVNDEDMITIRVKLSDREETPLRVTISREDKLKTVALKILEEAELPLERKIKIAYMGRILDMNETLLSQGWQEEHVVNAWVF